MQIVKQGLKVLQSMIRIHTRKKKSITSLKRALKQLRRVEGKAAHKFFGNKHQRTFLNITHFQPGKEKLRNKIWKSVKEKF